MKYLIFLSLITYTYACPAKSDAEWKALGCVVENTAGTDASGLGIVEPYTQAGYGSCSIQCTADVWVITQACATGYEENDCDICMACVQSSANQTTGDADFKIVDNKCEPCPENQNSQAGATSCSSACSFYKGQWLQKTCCTAYDEVECLPIKQKYEYKGCASC